MRKAIFVAAGLLAASFTPGLQAQEFPSRPITFIVASLRSQ